MDNEPKNILIIKPSSLGDIVLSLPALVAIKRSFPAAKISWLIRPEFADVVQGHPDLDEVILFDRRRLGKSWYSPGAFGDFIGLLKKLRESRFDLVFDFQGLLRTGFLTWATGSKKRFGMANSREGAHLFYTHKIEQDNSCIHLVDYYLRMVGAAGGKETAVEFKLPANKFTEEQVKELLAAEEVDIDNYIVFIPSAMWDKKCWPIERFSHLADLLEEKFGSSIVAIGSMGEWQYVDTMQSNAETRIVNLAGKTTLPQLTALLRNASLVVSNDTGPGHIAAATGVPLVMIFGPINPARLYPYNRPECVVAVEPIFRGTAIESKDPKYDITHITVEQVFEKASEQIAKRQKD